MTHALNALDIRNAYVVGHLIDATHAARRLVALGLTLISVEIDGRVPVLWIEDEPRTGMLPEPMCMVEHAGERVFTSPFEGCRVKWKRKVS